MVIFNISMLLSRKGTMVFFCYWCNRSVDWQFYPETILVRFRAKANHRRKSGVRKNRTTEIFIQWWKEIFKWRRWHRNHVPWYFVGNGLKLFPTKYHGTMPSRKQGTICPSALVWSYNRITRDHEDLFRQGFKRQTQRNGLVYLQRFRITQQERSKGRG